VIFLEAYFLALILKIAALQQQISDKDEALFELSATMATIQAETNHEQQKWQGQLQQLQQSLRHAQQEANLAHATLQHHQVLREKPHSRQQDNTDVVVLATSPSNGNNIRKRIRATTTANSPQDQRMVVTPPATAMESVVTNAASSTPRNLKSNAPSVAITTVLKEEHNEAILLARQVLSMIHSATKIPLSQYDSLASQLLGEFVSCSHLTLRQGLAHTIQPINLTECLIQLAVQEGQHYQRTDKEPLELSSLPWLVRCLTWSAKCRAHVRQELIAAFAKDNDLATPKAPILTIKTNKSRIRGMPNASEHLLRQNQDCLKEPLICRSTTSSQTMQLETFPTVSATKTGPKKKATAPILPVASSTANWQEFVRIISHQIVIGGDAAPVLLQSTQTDSPSPANPLSNAHSAINLVAVLLSDAPCNCPSSWIWFESLVGKSEEYPCMRLMSGCMFLVQTYIPPNCQTPRRRSGLPVASNRAEPQEVVSRITVSSNHKSSTAERNTDVSSGSIQNTKSNLLGTQPSSSPKASTTPTNNLNFPPKHNMLMRQWLLLRQLLSNSHRCRQTFFQQFQSDHRAGHSSSSLAECTLALVLDLLQQVVLVGSDDKNTEAMSLAGECLSWLQWFASICCHTGDEQVWNLLQTPMLLSMTTKYNTDANNQNEQSDNRRQRFGCSTVGVLIQLLHKVVLKTTSGKGTTPSASMMEVAMLSSGWADALLVSIVRTLNGMFLCTTTIGAMPSKGNISRKRCASWKEVILSEYPDLYKSACHSILAWAPLAAQSEGVNAAATTILPKHPEVVSNICQMIQYQLDELWQEI
jgi:hypothetical protein